MELANIEKLVAKYENAETTLKEENILRDYFLSDNVAPHLEEYQLMFTYFQASQGETFNKTLEFKTEKKRNYKWLSVAASVVLLFSVYMGIPKTEIIEPGTIPVSEMTIEEKFHYEQAREALAMLSGSLNKGSEAVSNLKTYENSVNKIFKTK
jgi:hypothetical protein